jgi:hypothetical protein
MPGVRNGLHFLRKSFDGMAWNEPSRLDAKAFEQLKQAGTADFACEKSARNIVWRILAAVRAEPSGDSIDVDAKSDKNILGH